MSPLRRSPRGRRALIGLLTVLTLAVIAPSTALASHFEGSSSATCGAVKLGKAVCTLTTAPEVGGPDVIESVISSSNASFASASRGAGMTCTSTGTGLFTNAGVPLVVSLLDPTTVNVAVPDDIEDCTVSVREVVNVTGPGEVCQTLDLTSGSNSPPETVCALPAGSQLCGSGVISQLCQVVYAKP